jgi:hypothetical protein
LNFSEGAMVRLLLIENKVHKRFSPVTIVIKTYVIKRRKHGDR